MDNLNDYTKEQLIEQIKALKAHNTQLQNIIAKSTESAQQPQSKIKRTFNFQKCKFQHVLLKFVYLGWDYQGYVTQEDTTNTIEHHIFNALTKTCLIESRATANYHRCGRTDKGVSSFSQVISIDLRSNSDETENELNYCKILNRVLPDNIQFIAWCPVDKDFSARFDCKNRTYKYFFPKGNLDIEKMNTASKYLIGNHDFRNFCKMDVNNGVTEFFRTISSVEISCYHGEENCTFSIYILTIRGNAFLWHQIRCIVGILILIGQNRENPEVVLELLDVENNPRKPDYFMASEIPLNLYDCSYENVNWISDRETVDNVRNKLCKFWTFFTIKIIHCRTKKRIKIKMFCLQATNVRFDTVMSAMIKSMILDVDKKSEEDSYCPSNFLIQGVKSRNYVPVMKRQLCESLENRIQHSLKRRKKKGEI